MALICGEQGYDVKIKDYTLTISIYTRFDSQKEEIKKLMEEINPSNMIANLIYEKALTFNIFEKGIISEANILTIRQVS